MEHTQIAPFHNALPHIQNQLKGFTLNLRNDYSAYLDAQDITYSIAGPYYVSGTLNENDTWLIHITVVLQQFDHLVRPILEFLKLLGVTFCIPLNADNHSRLLDGRNGFTLTGKVITVCAASPEEAKYIVKQLDVLTKTIKGPVMPCAYHLTAVIAVKYGTLFNDMEYSNMNGSIFYGSAINIKFLNLSKLNNIEWPFGEFRPLIKHKPPRLLNKNYIPIETFKKDPKGNVFKALKVNQVFNMEWCVIKQGRQYQSYDNFGRDAKDRLKWQFEMHQQFESKNILPKAIGYFEFYEDAFFAMDYKESVSLTEKAVHLSEGHTWRVMPAERKREMLSYLLQVINILGHFHDDGFVHRDVTPANFIVTETGQVFALDIELCYHIRTQYPNPPFNLGTPGFMSPAQENGDMPTYKDDIFSFGALLISLLTGVLPNKLNHKNPKQLKTNLRYFIDSPSLVNAIIACLNADADLRPSLAEIRAVLELCYTLLLTSLAPLPGINPSMADKNSVSILSYAFKTVSNLVFGLKSNISEKATATNRVLNSKQEYSGFTTIITPGFAEFAVLAMHHRYALTDLDEELNAYIQSWLTQTTTIELPDLEHQIFAKALTQLKPGTELLLLFMSKVNPLANDLNDTTSNAISGGMAGRGLKLLFLTDQQPSGNDLNQLAEIISCITEMQEKDGSWATAAQVPGRKRFKVIGFSHGVAGITYFLLSYYARYQSEDLSVRIELALKWLIEQRRSDRGKMTWPVSADNRPVDPWLEHGFSGVALTFIKAYEVLEHSIYKEIAEEVLAYHPQHVTSNYCAFGNGLSGLGEIYLEAYRVFGDDKWLIRASIIRDTLLNTCYRDDEVCYWLDGTQLAPIPDFWTGNAGILHFLLRFENPNQIHFPAHLIP
ncbi:serine/threonine protein kinase [Mucilaginibacter rubeus]|uniref:lanthionine synthetase LanC family protein n=1 Tax=Mucilaginibacter rubeus TaxID=2027860 RepID=UPI00339AEBAC